MLVHALAIVHQFRNASIWAVIVFYSSSYQDVRRGELSSPPCTASQQLVIVAHTRATIFTMLSDSAFFRSHCSYRREVVCCRQRTATTRTTIRIPSNLTDLKHVLCSAQFINFSIAPNSLFVSDSLTRCRIFKVIFHFFDVQRYRQCSNTALVLLLFVCAVSPPFGSFSTSR